MQGMREEYMSKPPVAKEAAIRAERASSKACELLETYQREADEASKEFESLRDAAKEAKTLASNLDKAVTRDPQPTAPATREAVTQLRTATSLRSAKAAAGKAIKELQAAADAAKRADEVLQPVPGHFAQKYADSKKNISQDRRKKAEVHADKVAEAIEAVSQAVKFAKANVLKDVEQLQAIDSLRAAAGPALAAERAADALKRGVVAVNKAVDSIEDSPEVRWPTTGIWVKASRRIRDVAKFA
jgi:hypothetical protein